MIPHRRSNSAFTLIELLVVISIIALLLAVIMPALTAAKRQAQSIICLSHLNGLSKSWLLYAEENNHEIIGANTGKAVKHEYSWVEAPQDQSGAVMSGSSTLEEKIIGIEKGLMYPYTETPDIYHCPGDKRSKGAAEAGSGIGGYRSYSIADGLRGRTYNPTTRTYRSPYGYDGHTKVTAIKSPGSKYVFMEDFGMQGYNVNGWGILIGQYKTGSQLKMSDPIAIFHGNSSTFAFADGHGQRHRWRQKEILDMAEVRTANSVINSGPDADFLARRFPYLKLVGN